MRKNTLLVVVGLTLATLASGLAYAKDKCVYVYEEVCQTCTDSDGNTFDCNCETKRTKECVDVDE